tara:strand:+ start:12096 stop:12944 length:849 start_codon:yes stop_codon:yes gene_type:complete
VKKVVMHIKAPDQRGIISNYTELFSSLNMNILKLEQHVESDDEMFFMRIEAEMLDKKLKINQLKKHLSKADKTMNATSKINCKQSRQNVAVFVSKESLPLYDILIKNKIKEIDSDIKCIISNHKTLEDIANQFNIEYMYLDLENKYDAEKQLHKILEKYNIDLIVLARYMQIIPDSIVDLYNERMINIHHSFLPAFKGGKPYHKAWNRGVKIIGATSHYVTKELDEGPIISQDVVHVDHHQSVKELINSGRNLERNVLIDAIKAHIDYRIMVHGKRTIVFSK